LSGDELPVDSDHLSWQKFDSSTVKIYEKPSFQAAVASEVGFADGQREGAGSSLCERSGHGILNAGELALGNKSHPQIVDVSSSQIGESGIQVGGASPPASLGTVFRADRSWWTTPSLLPVPVDQQLGSWRHKKCPPIKLRTHRLQFEQLSRFLSVIAFNYERHFLFQVKVPVKAWMQSIFTVIDHPHREERRCRHETRCAVPNVS
jgi:hypothetical protein